MVDFRKFGLPWWRETSPRRLSFSGSVFLRTLHAVHVSPGDGCSECFLNRVTACLHAYLLAARALSFFMYNVQDTVKLALCNGGAVCLVRACFAAKKTSFVPYFSLE